MKHRSNASQPPVPAIGSILPPVIVLWIADHAVGCFAVALAAAYWVGVCTGSVL